MSTSHFTNALAFSVQVMPLFGPLTMPLKPQA
jgi:hypothetical protein